MWMITVDAKGSIGKEESIGKEDTKASLLQKCHDDQPQPNPRHDDEVCAQVVEKRPGP